MERTAWDDSMHPHHVSDHPFACRGAASAALPIITIHPWSSRLPAQSGHAFRLAAFHMGPAALNLAFSPIGCGENECRLQLGMQQWQAMGGVGTGLHAQHARSCECLSRHMCVTEPACTGHHIPFLPDHLR